MCMCGFERGGGTLGGLGDRDREKGDRDRLAGAWLAGWTSEAEREASTAVTAVAIEVAVVACCPTSEQAREDEGTWNDRGCGVGSCLGRRWFMSGTTKQMVKIRRRRRLNSLSATVQLQVVPLSLRGP